jgi:hypothetical protein
MPSPSTGSSLVINQGHPAFSIPPPPRTPPSCVGSQRSSCQRSGWRRCTDGDSRGSSHPGEFASGNGYFSVRDSYVAGMSVLHWINDALMAVFFLLVGLEIKREFLDGQLATWRRRILPGIAAAGGMAVPALFYVALNISTRAGFRLRKCQGSVLRYGVVGDRGSRDTRNCSRIVRRQTARRVFHDIGRDQIEARRLAGECLIGAGLRGVAALRCQLHDEPVHRNACVPGLSQAGKRG